MNARENLALAVVAGLTLVALPAPRARAESAALPCYRLAEVLPRATGSVPVAAPGLVFIPAALVSERPISAYDLELRGPTGDVIAHTLEADGPAYVLKPAVPLGAGRHEVRYNDFCNFLPSQVRINEVKVEGTAALPATVGALASDVSPIVNFDGNITPTCQPVLVDITFVLDLSPQLAAYKDVARYQVSYKGRSKAFTYGQAYAFGTRVQLQVEDTCNLREAVGGEVTVAAHVAGAANDPAPLTFQLNAKCPGIGPEPKPPQVPPPPLPACGAMPDGGTIPDGGATPDGGTIPDGGTTSDVGTMSDGGTTPDVATMPDVGAGPQDTSTAKPDTGASAADASADVQPHLASGGGCQVSPLPARAGLLQFLLLLGVFIRRASVRRRCPPVS